MTLVLATPAEPSAAQSRAVERAAAWLRVCVAGFAATVDGEKASGKALEWQRHAHALGLEISRLNLEKGTARFATGQPALGAVFSPEETLTQRMLDYVHAHSGRPMSLGEMAAAFGLSVSHLSTVFHRATGIRFHEYFDSLRLKRAFELLAGPRCSIAEVAARAGYASDTWFRHAFKTHTGLSPSQWRAQHPASKSDS